MGANYTWLEEKKFTRSNNNWYAEIKNSKRLHKHTQKKKIKCFN